MALMKNNELLHDQIGVYEEKITKLDNELKMYKETTAEMKTTIETLMEENNVYINDLKRVHQELFTYKESFALSKPNRPSRTPHSFSPDIPATVAIHSMSSAIANVKKVPLKFNSRRIVVLTDSFGKNLYDFLSKELSNFKVQVISKPFSKFKDLVYTCDCYVSDLTVDDYVLVLAGLNDTSIRMPDITLLANKCFATNLIICSLPILPNSPYYSTYTENITSVNLKMMTVVERLKRFSISIDFLDLSNKFTYGEFTQSTIFLNKKGLARLGKIVRHCVLNFGSSGLTNLIYFNSDLTHHQASSDLALSANIQTPTNTFSEMNSNVDFL